jgi:uncharacterized protein
MAITLYEATIPSQLQILGGLVGVLDKAIAHCAASGAPEADLIEAKLAPDMFALPFQVKSAVVHSMGSIEAVRKGHFSPDRTPAPETLGGLKALVESAIAGLKAVDPAEVNGFEGKDMLFEAGDLKLPFTAENFLLSFSQPNFYFHAATAYDVLRMAGVALGKRDFLGMPRIKR